MSAFGSRKTSLPEPEPLILDAGAPHRDLHENIQRALLALPEQFRSKIEVSGVLAGDLFTLDDLFGATIEEQTVAILTDMRSIWDSERKYDRFSFVRQPQTSPDVLLQAREPDGATDILMGIELKGWYVFAKEGEPRFRMEQSPDACALRDLICVVPWALTSVISGIAQVFEPYIKNARYAAQYRNWHWNTTGTEKHTPVRLAENVGTYPTKSDEVCDSVESDRGGNFGRLARTGLMDDFKNKIYLHRLAGIDVKHWRRFFKVFTERRTDEERDQAVERVIRILSTAIESNEKQAELQRLRKAVESVGEDLRQMESD